MLKKSGIKGPLLFFSALRRWSRHILRQRLPHLIQSQRRGSAIFETVNEVHASSVFRLHRGALRHFVEDRDARGSPITPVGRDDRPPAFHIPDLIKETGTFRNGPELDAVDS